MKYLSESVIPCHATTTALILLSIQLETRDYIDGHVSVSVSVCVLFKGVRLGRLGLARLGQQVVNMIMTRKVTEES